MLALQIKETFQQKVTDILLVLVVIHYGSVMLSVLIKWIHPYMKNFRAMYDSSKLNSVNCEAISSEPSINAFENKNRRQILEENESYSYSDDDFFSMVESLKLIIDANYNPTEEFSNLCRKENLSNDTSFGIENAEGISNIMKYSNEVQTIVTINPKLQLDLSLPNLMNNQVSSKVLIKSESCESFITAVSHFTLSDYENDYASTLYPHLDCSDPLHLKNENNCSSEQTQISKVTDCVTSKPTSVNIPIDKPNANSLNDDYGKHINLENEALEKAIKDFEKELRPIQDQIKVLKQCLSVYGNGCTAYSSDSSDFSSSISETIWQSECFSGVRSSTCCSSTFRQMSSLQSFIAKEPSPYKCVMKSKKRSSKLSLNSRKIDVDKYFNTPVVNIASKQVSVSSKPDLKRRSPLAEMYVTLAQSTSQSSYFWTNRKHLSPHPVNGNTVTCRINVNVSVDTVSIMNVHSRLPTSRLKNQAMIPVLSDPDEMLGPRSEKPSRKSHLFLSKSKQEINPKNDCKL